MAERIEKVAGHTPDLVQANIDAIASLFPNVVTEVAVEGPGGGYGLRRAVDFDLLRQELADHLVEGPAERYRLDWPGKREGAFAANAPEAITLRPVREESVDFDTTQNLFIEGDNLQALKLLQDSYLGKVKLIYIDPPYNTGNDFIYNDDFAESAAEYLERSGQVDGEGGKLVTNTESNGRFHSDWLSMMYPRLKLARNLLTDDGVVFVSIDECEVANLLRICEEVFGAENVLGALPAIMNLKGNQDAFGFAETHEFVVTCLRSKLNGFINNFEVDEEALLADWQEDSYGLYKEADNLRATGVNAPRVKRPNLWYPIFIDAESGVFYVSDDDQPRDMTHVTLLPVSPDGEELSWYWSKRKFVEQPHNLILKQTKNGYQFYKKQRASIGDIPTRKPKSFFYSPEYSTSSATKQLKELLGGRLFSAPKPVPLLRDLVYLGTSSDSVVLDLFAGSGTTAHAVMAANAADGGNRRFIMVQLDEATPEDSAARQAGYDNIAQLSRERIRRAGAKIKDEAGLTADSLDVGFRTLKVDSTNYRDVRLTPDNTDQGALEFLADNIKADRTPEDLLFQVMLDWGLDLASPIERVEIAGAEVFIVEDGGLVACFAHEVSDAVIRGIAERKPTYAVFRDSSFASDDAQINAKQIFTEVSPDTALKVI